MLKSKSIWIEKLDIEKNNIYFITQLTVNIIRKSRRMDQKIKSDS